MIQSSSVLESACIESNVHPVWTKLGWVSGLPKGLGERRFYTGEWGGGEEKGSWVLWSTLIFGGDAGWNSIVRYVAWCVHWLKRHSISCVTDSWSLGGKLAETLLTSKLAHGKNMWQNFLPLFVSVQNSRRDRYGKVLSWRNDYGNNFEDCI